MDLVRASILHHIWLSVRSYDKMAASSLLYGGHLGARHICCTSSLVEAGVIHSLTYLPPNNLEALTTKGNSNTTLPIPRAVLPSHKEPDPLQARHEPNNSTDTFHRNAAEGFSIILNTIKLFAMGNAPSSVMDSLVEGSNCM